MYGGRMDDGIHHDQHYSPTMLMYGMATESAAQFTVIDIVIRVYLVMGGWDSYGHTYTVVCCATRCSQTRVRPPPGLGRASAWPGPGLVSAGARPRLFMIFLPRPRARHQ